MSNREQFDDETSVKTSEETTADKAFNERRVSTHRWIKALLDLGYRWNAEKKNELVHPEDSELNAWHNPYTEELLFSPRLQEQLTQMLRGALPSK